MRAIFLCVILCQYCSSDWISEWADPVSKMLNLFSTKTEHFGGQNFQNTDLRSEILTADQNEYKQSSLRDEIDNQIELFTSQLKKIKKSNVMDPTMNLKDFRTNDRGSIKHFGEPTENLRNTEQNFKELMNHNKEPMEYAADYIDAGGGTIEDLRNSMKKDKELKANFRGPLNSFKDRLRKYREQKDYRAPTEEISKGDFRRPLDELKRMLTSTLEKAKILADTLRRTISATEAKENLLREAIVTGRGGVSTVKITPLGQAARMYLIRDGRWSECDGAIQPPGGASETEYEEGYDYYPHCLGKETGTRRDECAFTAVTKYETVPLQRGERYTERDFLCLHFDGNRTLQQFLSVPRRIVNDTCNGVVHTPHEENARCGERTLSEYTYRPSGAAARRLPLEYCESGVCRLLLAWRVSDGELDNAVSFAHLGSFQKYFVGSIGQGRLDLGF